MTYIITLPVGYKPVLKHGDHDQSSHGSWATGITEELSNWSPKDSVPASPRNAGGMTEKIWDNWEHGVDGYQYVELYRQYAGEALGIAVPQSDMDTGGQLNYLTTRGFGGSSIDAARNQAEAMLKAIANGKPEQPALYRGMVATDEVSQELIKGITSLKAGDTLDMPLVSTTRSLGVASWYALDRNARGTDSVIMKIQDGAKGVSLSKENSWYPQDHEVITSGKFEVVGISKIETPYWKREILEPRELKWTDGTPPDYEVVGTKQNLGDPKKVYETVTSGNWKSLETPTFKLTDDRRSSPERPILSAWVKQPAREVTVVEVKFVDSHVVKKAEAKDYGLTFDALFNDVPFIRDEEEVAKHGDHDQSEHGNWATGDGVASPKGGSPEQEAMYTAAYSKSGYEPAGRSPRLKDGTEPILTEIGRYGVSVPVKYGLPENSEAESGLTVDEYRALQSYQGKGYSEINERLRQRDEEEALKFDLGRKISVLDSLMAKVPEVKSETPLYRLFSKKVVDDLESGQIYKDKGFLSTSHLDFTDSSNSKALDELMTNISFKQEMIVGRIIPNGVYSGLSINSLIKDDGFYGSEKEFILPRGSELRFLGLSKTSSGEPVMDFERVSK
jgi:hypothetical protein